MDSHLTPADSQINDHHAPSAFAQPANSALTALARGSWDGVPLYGDIAVRAIIEALYGGLSDGKLRYQHVSGPPTKGELTGIDHVVWRGHFPDKEVTGKHGQSEGKVQLAGIHFVPNPFRGSVIRDIASRNGTGFLRYGSGLKAEFIGCLPVNYAEIDDCPRSEQAQRLLAFEVETGLQWTVLSLSGDVRPESTTRATAELQGRWGAYCASRVRYEEGKSIHGFMAVQGWWSAGWVRAQKLINALLGADKSLDGPRHPLRFPGVLGTQREERHTVRVQTCVSVTGTVYEAKDVLVRLEGAAKARGIDIDVALPGSGTAGIWTRNGKGKSKHPFTYADFTKIPFVGTNLYEWIKASVPAGGTRPIGSPSTTDGTDFHPNGHSSTAHHDPDGRVWVHVWKDTERNYFHQDTAERLPEGVEDMALVSTTDAPVAPTGERLEAIKNRLAQTIAELKALDLCRGKRTEIRALKPYRAPVARSLTERVASRQKEAAALCPEEVKAADAVKALARLVEARFREILCGHPDPEAPNTKGLYLQKPAERCGYWTGLKCVISGKNKVFKRPCKGLSCWYCAPMIWAEKYASICAMVIMEDGEVTGRPMEEREVFLYGLTAMELEGFVNRIKMEGRKLTRSGATKEKKRQAETDPPLVAPERVSFEGSHAYVTLQVAPNLWVAFSTLGLGTSQRGSRGYVLRVRGVDAVRQLVQGYMELAIRPVRALGPDCLDDQPMEMDPVVDAKITSSKNLCLNPDRNFRLRADHSWSAREKYTRPAAEVLDIHHTLEGGLVKAKLTGENQYVELAGMPDLSRDDQFWEKVKAPDAPREYHRQAAVVDGFRETMGPQYDLAAALNSAGLDALFDAALALTAPVESHSEPTATSMELTSMEAQGAQEVPATVPSDARSDHHDGFPNAAVLGPTPPTAASEVMVGPDPGTALGEALVPRRAVPMTDWEAMEAML